MNTNRNSDKVERQGQEHQTALRIRIDNQILATTQNTDNKVYSTNYNTRSHKSAKGFDGLSQKEKELIDLSMYKFINEYGLDNCKVFTFTFDKYCDGEHTSNEALINLASKYDKLIAAIQYQLKNRIYKRYDIKPYLIVTGLRKRTCHDRELPCFDINVICLVKDKDGNQIFNEDDFVKAVYASASNYARETIKVPLDFYGYLPYDKSETKTQFANYLKYHQVTSDLLALFHNSEYVSLIPKSYVYIHSSLKQTFEDIKKTYSNSNASEHKHVMIHKCPDVQIHESSGWDSKFTATYVGESRDEFIADYEQKYYSLYPDRLENVSDFDTLT